MQQPNAPMLLDCLLYELCRSSTARVTCLNRQHLSSNNTNSLANQVRVSDRVQTSACDRRTRLMSMNRPL
eukprot:9144145-Pyramimonas_sp.AAC.1